MCDPKLVEKETLSCFVLADVPYCIVHNPPVCIGRCICNLRVCNPITPRLIVYPGGGKLETSSTRLFVT